MTVPAAVARDGATRYAATREVRFAVVMYGGISLAIYINGVAQELFRLVQATAPEAGEQPSRLRVADGDLSPSARVYRGLARQLDGDDDGVTVRTRFVVDILSGSSAGGINGVLLAKALVNGRDFSGPAARIWLEVADLAALLLPRTARKRALLDGDRLYDEARAVLAQLAHEGDDLHAAGYVEQLDLAVTATDRGGLDAHVELRPGAEVAERQHRTVFAFSHGSDATSGERHSDFGADRDRMLAFAARATSSFPVAFEPVSLDALPEPVPRRDVERWLRDHVRAGLEPARVLFGDGGFLDNKPFTHATRALRRRRADLPVRRLLLYVEPDPAGTSRPAAATTPLDRGPVANALAAFTLPRAEPIRQDVLELTERNARIGLLRRAEQDEIDMVREGAAAGGESYLRLRCVMAAERLAEVAAELDGWEPDGSRQRAATAELFDAITVDLLPNLDIAYQRRRLSFLHDRVNELVREAEAPAPLLRLKRELNEAFAPLRAAQRLPSAANRDALLAAHEGWAPLFAEVERGASARPFRAVGYLATVAAFLADPLRRTDEAISGALKRAGIPWLLDLDARFESIDRVVLPLAHPDLGELNAVAVHRVSPLDARRLTTLGNRKLAGIGFHHFGGFLSRRFRWNDLLWGRLDAVEAIADALLPGPESEPERERFRIRAQAAILREVVLDERTDDGAEMRRRIVSKLRGDAATARDEEVVEAFRAAATAPEPLTSEERSALRRQLRPALWRLLRIEVTRGLRGLLCRRARRDRADDG